MLMNDNTDWIAYLGEKKKKNPNKPKVFRKPSYWKHTAFTLKPDIFLPAFMVACHLLWDIRALQSPSPHSDGGLYFPGSNLSDRAKASNSVLIVSFIRLLSKCLQPSVHITVPICIGLCPVLMCVKHQCLCGRCLRNASLAAGALHNISGGVALAARVVLQLAAALRRLQVTCWTAQKVLLQVMKQVSSKAHVDPGVTTAVQAGQQHGDNEGHCCERRDKHSSLLLTTEFKKAISDPVIPGFCSLNNLQQASRNNHFNHMCSIFTPSLGWRYPYLQQMLPYMVWICKLKTSAHLKNLKHVVPSTM